jgi:hypothetical protein
LSLLISRWSSTVRRGAGPCRRSLCTKTEAGKAPLFPGVSGDVLHADSFHSHWCANNPNQRLVPRYQMLESATPDSRDGDKHALFRDLREDDGCGPQQPSLASRRYSCSGIRCGICLVGRTSWLGR